MHARAPNYSAACRIPPYVSELVHLLHLQHPPSYSIVTLSYPGSHSPVTSLSLFVLQLQHPPSSIMILPSVSEQYLGSALCIGDTPMYLYPLAGNLCGKRARKRRAVLFVFIRLNGQVNHTACICDSIPATFRIAIDQVTLVD